MPILEVKNLYKKFQKTPVLKGIDFSLEKGETLAIIGSSGSGKTTLLRCLNFLEKPDRGTIAVNGEVLFNADERRGESETEIRKKRLHFGLVFQSFNLFPQYTALENVMLASTLFAKEREDYHKDKKAILAGVEEDAKELLRQVGLADKEGSYPHQLSGGQQQRVAIARALINDPPLILADEPTGNLDSTSGMAIINLLDQLRQAGKTILIATHDPRMLNYATHKIYLLDGRIVDENTYMESIQIGA